MANEVGDWFQSITIGGVGIWTIVAGVAVALIRQKPIMQRLFNEREGNLLKERAKEMRLMRARIAQLEGEARVDRHDRANIEQSFDMLLMLIELNPEKAQEAAAKVRKVRNEQKQQIAQERAALIADSIAVAKAEDSEDEATP